MSSRGDGSAKASSKNPNKLVVKLNTPAHMANKNKVARKSEKQVDVSAAGAESQQQIDLLESLDSFDYGSHGDKSLTALTAKFMSLLQESPTGILDLRNLVESIPSRQKRRVYDITNVLEGIGLIEKYSKNSIRWKGGGPNTNSNEAQARFKDLQAQVERLEKEENALDEQIRIMQTNRSLLLNDQSSSKYQFVSKEDVFKFVKTRSDSPQTVLLVRPNQDSLIEVAEPTYIYNNLGVGRKYFLNVKNSSKPVDVYLADRAVSIEENNVEETKKAKKSQSPVSNSNEPNLVLLKPQPSAKDYTFGLERTQGISDMFNF